MHENSFVVELQNFESRTLSRTTTKNYSNHYNQTNACTAQLVYVQPAASQQRKLL